MFLKASTGFTLPESTLPELFFSFLKLLFLYDFTLSRVRLSRLKGSNLEDYDLASPERSLDVFWDIEILLLGIGSPIVRTEAQLALLLAYGRFVIFLYLSLSPADKLNELLRLNKDNALIDPPCNSLLKIL